MPVVFELFRYQLLPVDRHLQLDLISGIKSVDELIYKKNEIFQEALTSVKTFYHPRTDVVAKRLYTDETFFLYRLAANRSIHRETKEFSEEYIDNWPSVLTAVGTNQIFNLLQYKGARLHSNMLSQLHK